MVKVRFAPSPSGSLHIGSARTAIVNYLFAKSLGGKYLLRIEDTDKVRSNQESKDSILTTLHWLGITWDEGPFYQSTRFPIYQKYMDQLLQSGDAYRCFCSLQDSNSQKDKQDEENLYISYDARCSKLSRNEIQEKLKKKTPYIIRLKMPTEKIYFNDLLKGDMTFQGDLLSDSIIARSDGSPTYNFAVVVDDYLMGITHVIRGEDHLSNTPKQLAIYKALGWDIPKFCHIPLILGSDRTKLSKRHGDTTIEDYKNKGFLPEAIFCYLALLGYSRNPTKEIFDQRTLFENFKLDQLSPSPSQFDFSNLIWMNAQFIKTIEPELLWERSQDWLESIPMEIEKKKRIFSLSLNQIKKLDDLPGIFKPFLNYSIHQENPDIQKIMQTTDLLPYVKNFFEKIEQLSIFDEDSIKILLDEIISRNSINKRSFIQIIRLVLMGTLVSPPLFDTFLLLGRKEVLFRYGLFISEIKNDKKN